jgi:hypothetical protein
MMTDMNAIEARQIFKAEAFELFGLLGPNRAEKPINVYMDGIALHPVPSSSTA